MKQKSPSIGIVACAREHGHIFVSSSYIQAVADHDGHPFLIPFFEDADSRYFRSCTESCDGFLFCGGADVNPLLFGQLPSHGLGDTDYDFDRFQLHLLTFLLNHSEKPVLGLCKGMQLLNLASGGTIYQDLSEHPGSFNHNPSTYSRYDAVHPVRTKEHTLLSALLGKKAVVNSSHHQAVKEPGITLEACAWSPDGVIEAVEGKNHPFLLGLQWHPEYMYLSSGKMDHVFSSFIHACRQN